MLTILYIEWPPWLQHLILCRSLHQIIGLYDDEDSVVSNVQTYCIVYMLVSIHRLTKSLLSLLCTEVSFVYLKYKRTSGYGNKIRSFVDPYKRKLTLESL